jgi:hypothetical protein
MKPTRYTNFLKFYFVLKLCVFRTVPVSIIRSFSLYTQQWCMSYRFVDSFRTGSGWNWSCCSKAVYKSVWHTPLLCLRWKTPGEGHRNFPKYVDFHSKIKFEKISASSWFYCKDHQGTLNKVASWSTLRWVPSEFLAVVKCVHIIVEFFLPNIRLVLKMWPAEIYGFARTYLKMKSLNITLKPDYFQRKKPVCIST